MEHTNGTPVSGYKEVMYLGGYKPQRALVVGKRYGRSVDSFSHDGLYYDLRLYDHQKRPYMLYDIHQEHVKFPEDEVTYVASGGWAMPVYHKPKLVKS